MKTCVEKTSSPSMPEDEKLPVKLSLPLEFQQNIFRELREEDELVVLARGLGLLRIVTNLLHSYDAAGGNLIILVGADERENGWIGESLAEHAAISMAPKARGLDLVQTDLMTVGTREQKYSKGGIFSITSRILIVDLLSGLLDPTTITGMVVMHADRIVATSMEAFILRIYRQKNKTGFLKAFSDSPEPFTTGFAPLTTMMRNLFLRRPALYPRFHVTVASSLEGKKKAEVIELEVPMTEAMKDIQNAILECVEVSITELKKGNSSLEMEDWTLDSALHRNFDSIIRRQLDPVWHRTSFRTKQIVRDLTLLRNILHFLLTNDAVSFNKYLDTVLASSTPPPGSTRQNQSPWLFLDAAHTIFDTARRRVYTGKLQQTDEKGPDALRPLLEELPKWEVMADILDEIERDAYFNPVASSDSNGTILIMGGDQSTCRQIREYLSAMYVGSDHAQVKSEDDEEVRDLRRSAAAMMRRKLRHYLTWKRDFAKVSASLFAENEKSINGSSDHRNGRNDRGKAPVNKRRRQRGGGAAGSTTSRTVNGVVHLPSDRDAHIADLMSELNPTEAERGLDGHMAYDPGNNDEDCYKLFEMKELLMIHPYDGDKDEQILEEVRPRYIIMYEPDAAFIRRVEVYRSSHTDRDVRVYFLYYGGSVEEQRYLSAVRREKDAFTKLIRERSTMAVTLTTDSRGVEDPQDHFLRTVNTRIAGGGRLAATSAPPRVVIDVREFRSSLPSLLHARSMDIIPCMLTVGDYVLTPDICIERKSVADLISSFKDGRLHSQAETMLLHYKSPMLLIEFDQNKSFTLEPFADLTLSGGSSLASLNPNASNDLQSKLVLLTIAFPRLRIIWSSSPYQTAEIFEELKKQQDEPDPMKAVQIGLEAGQEAEQQTFSQVPQDMLRAVPGITSKNMSRLTLEVDNVFQVAQMEVDEMEPMMGKESARQIHRFFNKDVFDE
ncbi:MAG: hypothetical protein M1828_002615 [Chrysothrix sp. TS-e1954]|nr:MAG: hypothetical protein M1828_002615 [Chrysothrix sp. TS-e1954]